MAICTLSSHDLLETLAQSPLAAQVAIIGPLETENLGIERMLATLLERPGIRWLVVCGDERRGRYQAQALRALFTHGLGPDGAIPEARSKRARLPALQPAHVDAARSQVSLRDLVGVHDADRIAAEVAACLAANPGPVQTAPATVGVPPPPEPFEVPTRPYRLEVEDPSGFLVILVDRPNARLLVEHYGTDGRLIHRLAGADAESLCAALLEWQIVSRLDHAAYLGRELMKAEIALQRGLTYRQDEPLG